MANNHMFGASFKTEYSQERRIEECAKILEKYPNRIPIVVEKHESENSIPEIDQNKFLIPSDFDFQQFQAVIRKRLHLKSTQVIYFQFPTNKIYGADKKMSLIYEDAKDTDKFLYIKYSAENYTG